MGQRKRKKSFVSSHIKGWIAAAVFVIVWYVVSDVYRMFSAAFEASVATNQVNDSIVEYSMVQKIVVWGMFPTTINVIFLVILLFCLYPTVHDLIKRVS